LGDLYWAKNQKKEKEKKGLFNYLAIPPDFTGLPT
jgi:hypothetical protein